MKKIMFFVLFCIGSVSNSYATTLDFTDLSQWTIFEPPGSSVQVIPDPISAGNNGGSGNVLALTGSPVLVSKAPLTDSTISFDYEGSPFLGAFIACCAGQAGLFYPGGGAVELSTTPDGKSVYTALASGGISSLWGTGPSGGGVGLYNYGNWSTYSAAVNPGSYLVLTATLNDTDGPDGVLFRNSTVDEGNGNPLPVPEPATYSLMLLGIGMIGFVKRRNKNAGLSLKMLA